MATDSEILRTANLLVEQYGEMAPVGAKIKADQLDANGDGAGHKVWLRVARATEDLLAQDRPSTSTLH